ncbi:CLUMA_CG015705, isoform A [Clunio marinus]|uniref:CLUMA_CG015705, isoform A n=1 Tax=Clunio marinus TaxID=568069 RepID=A0A1J1IST7_9DIPT|nr:CLUMA_CG015705, isoform A [Clunio marinus]
MLRSIVALICCIWRNETIFKAGISVCLESSGVFDYLGVLLKTTYSTTKYLASNMPAEPIII